MKNINIYLFMGLLVFFPLWFASAALNSYLKLDGASGSVEATSTGLSPNASSGTVTPEPLPPPAGQRDVFLEIGGVEGELRTTSSGARSGASAGTVTTQPALPPGGSRDIYLDIEDIEGEAAEKSAEDAGTIQNTESEEKGIVQYNESDLEMARQNSVAVEAREIRGWSDTEKNDFIKTVKAHAEVKSGQDLENFAKGVLLKDENAESIEANEESVKISYKMPARFLGVFRTSITAHVEVLRNGEVNVFLPWYAFLFKKLVSTGDVESEARASLPEVGDEVLVSFESRARAMTTLSNIMKTKHDTVKNSIGNIR